MADFSYRLAVSYELLLEANIAKYTQNPDLLMKLMEKAGTRMIEATDHNQIWASGLRLGDPQLYDLDRWTGYNFFGDLLTLLAEAFLVIKFTCRSPEMPLSPEALQIIRAGPQNPILERLQHPTQKTAHSTGTTTERLCAETEQQNLPDEPLGVVFVHHQDDTWESLTKEQAEEHRILITQKDIAPLPAKIDDQTEWLLDGEDWVCRPIPLDEQSFGTLNTLGEIDTLTDEIECQHGYWSERFHYEDGWT